MGGQIQRLVKGGVPTLLEASKGNELIDAINALQVQLGSYEGIIQDLLGRVIELETKKKKDILVRPPLYLRNKPDDTQEIILSGRTKHIRYCGGAGHLLHLDDPYDVEDEYGANFD